MFGDVLVTTSSISTCYASCMRHHMCNTSHVTSTHDMHFAQAAAPTVRATTRYCLAAPRLTSRPGPLAPCAWPTAVQPGQRPCKPGQRPWQPGQRPWPIYLWRLRFHAWSSGTFCHVSGFFDTFCPPKRVITSLHFLLYIATSFALLPFALVLFKMSFNACACDHAISTVQVDV